MEHSPEHKKTRIAEKAEELKSTYLDTEEEKASRKSRDTDDPVDMILYHPLSIKLAHVCIKTHISANAVTLLSLFVGVAGAVLFYPQNRWINLIGILIVMFAAVLDCCDGQIARLTHTSSQLGRFLDGLADTTGFLAIYIVLGLRMMKENIPFTETPWSYYIWIVIIIAMIFHASQARIADYYRGLHLFFLNGSSRANLTRSKDLRAEIDSLSGDSPLYQRIYRRVYLIYTKEQERITPCAQRLLDAMEEQEGCDLEKLSRTYVEKSRRYIQLTNVLTYNIRAFALFLLLMLGLHVYFFPFGILVLEVVRLVMVHKYEAIAREIYEEFFPARVGDKG